MTYQLRIIVDIMYNSSKGVIFLVFPHFYKYKNSGNNNKNASRSVLVAT